MQKISSFNTIEFCHLIKEMLYIIQYILKKYSKLCAHFYCGKSSDNIFWTPHKLKYMPNMQNSEWEIFYVNRSSGPCVPPHLQTTFHGQTPREKMNWITES